MIGLLDIHEFVLVSNYYYAVFVRFSMVKILMTANELDVNPVDDYKNIPLHVACEDGNVEVVKLLLNAGADRSRQNKDEKTPFELAKPELLRIFRNMTID